jgi:hypothetical protein
MWTIIARSDEPPAITLETTKSRSATDSVTPADDTHEARERIQHDHDDRAVFPSR